jgi:AraC-like DNA-binding protein
MPIRLQASSGSTPNNPFYTQKHFLTTETYFTGFRATPIMNQCSSILPVNYSNIPVLLEETSEKPFGQFIPTPQQEACTFDNQLGSIHSSDMYLPNFSIRLTEGKVNRSTEFFNQRGQGLEFAGSCLVMKGNVDSFIPRNSEHIKSLPRSQNFKYDPQNEFHHVFQSGIPFQLIHFSLTKEFLNQLLPEHEQWSKSLKKHMAGNERIAGPEFVKITTAQEQALQLVLNNPLSGSLGISLAEAAITQVIAYQMHALFHKQTVSETEKFSRRDVELIYSLKEYLQKTFLQDHSINSLSREVGVNPNKLMKLFKDFFNTSIFSFITELRMNHAKQLLKEQDLQISEVSRTIGYKNPNHFAVAFKKQFGCIPSRVR